MRAPWKWMIGSVVALTALAFVVGMMTRSGIDVPAERTPIVIQDAETSTGTRPDRTASKPPAARPARKPSPSPRRPAEEKDRGVPGDDRVAVVNPGPDDIGTADDDAGRDDEPDDETDDETDDDAGEGGGDD